MPSSSLNATHSSLQGLSYASSPPDFKALGTALQETAHALLAMQPANAPDEATEQAVTPPTHKGDGEIRSYYLPPATVHMEKELLQKYRVNDFQGLLEEAHTLLVGLIKLMQSVHKDVRVRGYVISREALNN